ncbi:hypothetical protein OQA88_3123 [Cercophora sp. LCS_1]
MAIKTVAVVGASGNVGTPIVAALLKAGFTVTAITRESSTSTFPSGVNVRRADLNSIASLTAAFQGQDAVVATVASESLGNQHILADAALAAGVKRFIPSEFGHNTNRLSGLFASILAAKAATTEHVTKLAEANPSFSWTNIATSPFFDWGFDHGFWGIDLGKKTVQLFDSGNEVVSTSTLAFVGESVVKTLQREEETRNKYLDVREFNITQNEVLKIIEEETGEKFAVTKVRVADLQKAGEDALARGDYGASFVPLLLAWNFADGGNHAITDEQVSNELLGLESRDVREVLREYIRSRSA